MLIFQDLEASIQSARIRTGVNEMMSRFGRRPARLPPLSLPDASPRTTAQLRRFWSTAYESAPSPHPGQRGRHCLASVWGGSWSRAAAVLSRLRVDAQRRGPELTGARGKGWRRERARQLQQTPLEPRPDGA